MHTLEFWLSLQQYGLKLDTSQIGMRKSELLGRLMRGEEVRRRPCPKHKGHMWCTWGIMENMQCCDGTGWLKNA